MKAFDGRVDSSPAGRWATAADKLDTAALMQNLPLGIVGLFPTPQYADLLKQAMYWEGRKREAFEIFTRLEGSRPSRARPKTSW